MMFIIWTKHYDKNFLSIPVHLLTGAWLFVTPWTAAHQASLSFTISQSLLQLMSIDQWCPKRQKCSLDPSLADPGCPAFLFVLGAASFLWWLVSLLVFSFCLVMISGAFPMGIFAAWVSQRFCICFRRESPTSLLLFQIKIVLFNSLVSQSIQVV